MIRYTGNPYVDAGVAVLELRLRKPVADFTESDLEKQARLLESKYAEAAWKGYLRLHFPNSPWTNPNPKILPEDRKRKIDDLLRAFEAPPLEPRQSCAACGNVAQIRADRSRLPMLTGERVLSAGALGVPGFPICGYCLFAIQFYPLGTLNVREGRFSRPLFWWSSDPEWNRRLTRRFQSTVEKVLAASSERFSGLPWPHTRLIEAARGVVADLKTAPTAVSLPLCDVCGIHASNDLQRPEYDVIRIPRGLLDFWSDAGNFGSLYREIEESAWIVTEKSHKRYASEDEESALTELSRKNGLYEDLGKAFRTSDFRDQAKRIAVRFFMRRKDKVVRPNTTALVEFFLEKVASMEKQRLGAIREIADAISASPERKQLLNTLMRSGRGIFSYVSSLRAVQRTLAKDGSAIPWDRILLALNLSTEEDVTSTDVRLVRELVLIRIFENLSTDEPPLLEEITDSDETAFDEDEVK